MNGCNFYYTHVNNINSNVNPYINSIIEYNDTMGDIVIAKGDSVATNNYWFEEDKQILSGIKSVQGPSVILPDGFFISSTKEE